MDLQQIAALAALAISLGLGKMVGIEINRRAKARREAEINPDAAYEAFVADMATVRPRPVRSLNYDPQPNEVEFLEAPIPTVEHLDTTSMDLSSLTAAVSTYAWTQVDAAPGTDRETLDAETVDEDSNYYVPSLDARVTGFGGERDCE